MCSYLGACKLKFECINTEKLLWEHICKAKSLEIAETMQKTKRMHANYHPHEIMKIITDAS